MKKTERERTNKRDCSDDLRAWFIKQECALFRYRFEQESLEEKKNFLGHLNLNWKIVSSFFLS